MRIKSLFAYFCIFVFLYEVNFVYIPFFTSKQIMEIVGFIMFISDRKALSSIKRYRDVFLLAASLILIALISIIVNGGGQMMYHMVFVSTILNYFGAFFLYKVSKNTVKTLDKFFKVVLYCVFIQCCITLLFRIYPSFYNLTYSIIWSEAVSSNIEYGIADLYRLVGLGNAVAFAVLPTSALGMLICSMNIVNNKGKRFYLYSLMLFFIICVSFLVARTSLLLAAWSIFYIVYSFYKSNKFRSILSIIITYSLLFSLLISVAIIILPQDMYLWAFEVFLNIQDGGSGAESGTGELLHSMATETNFSPLTFLIGDAKYVNLDGSYYGHVDIGFYRQVLYYGLPGLFVFLMLHYIIIKKCIRRTNDKDLKTFFMFLFYSLLIILMKGDTVLVSIFIMLLVMVNNMDPLYNTKMLYNQKINKNSLYE